MVSTRTCTRQIGSFAVYVKCVIVDMLVFLLLVLQNVCIRILCCFVDSFN